MRFPTGVNRDRFNLITAVLAKHARLKVRTQCFWYIGFVWYIGHKLVECRIPAACVGKSCCVYGDNRTLTSTASSLFTGCAMQLSEQMMPCVSGFLSRPLQMHAGHVLCML